MTGVAEIAMREAGLFAAAGFLLFGAGDVAVDFLWLAGRPTRRSVAPGVAKRPGRLAVFTPAWDEAAVIGAMLAHAGAAFAGDDHVHYVGCYPNDPDTIAAARAAAGPSARLVVGPAPGPTSKADCLNRIWERMVADEEASGIRFKAVVLHDAEDVVHSAELGLFDALIERFDLVQLPVVPLIDPGSRWISGSYADSFAEAHGKELVVRSALGASLPAAGVGCAVARDALAALAEARGAPFDPDSLTEDYELGLRLAMAGRSAAFVRLPAGPGRPAIATRAYFPATLRAAVAQRARWTAGIALRGWDRLGWSGGPAERWMRMRDRRAPLAALLLFAGYLAVALWAGLAAAALLSGRAPGPLPDGLALLLSINGGLLAWRLVMRFGFVTATHGWREGLRSAPRIPVANLIDILAAGRAILRYLAIRRGGAPVWDKTAHLFPPRPPAE